MDIYTKELLIQIYHSNTVLWEYATPGTYTLDIKSSGVYGIELVGGGGAGNQLIVGQGGVDRYQAGGGSGACYRGDIQLSSGLYSLAVGGVGGGATTLSLNGNIIISCGGGGNAPSGLTAGGGGGLTNNATVISTLQSSNGNAGNNGWCSWQNYVDLGGDGGGSVYNGYGKGQSVKLYSPSDAIGGYAKITFKYR